ncbi:hypothetical protein GQ53DRAFT_390910 [Thozetella sp. PMI_491]|nr:hypothetical protein GQ53DRAFT_390910 [Thozetella sp. PMI_491]
MALPDPILNPGAYQRHLYTSTFRASVAAGEARPLVIPYSLAGVFILPVLYLCIPHKRRPWLHHMRYAILAAMVFLNAHLLLRTSSTNMAGAYATGLAAAWGIVWGSTLLLFMRPQFDAARVARRRKKRKHSDEYSSETIRRGQENGHMPAYRPGEKSSGGGQVAPDESVAAALIEYEYYWQSYPENGSFLERLDWSMDLATAFRGSGWNWTIQSIPHFKRPENPGSGESVQLDSIPLSTRAGYTRYATYRSFLLNRLWHIGWGYIVLDFSSVMMMKDPYFIFGPETTHPLPPYLTSLSPWVLEVYRSAITLAGVLGALFMIMSFDHVIRCVVLGTRTLGVHGELWHYPSLFGSFDCVLDRGLPGLWGGWWHQSFRVAFVAPTLWLVKRGYLAGDHRSPIPRLVAVFIALLQSGLLHAAGGVSAIPNTTKAWTPVAFFMLSFVGIVVQQAWCRAFQGQIQSLPRGWRRAGNLIFVTLWLHFTRWGLIDDMCRAGLFLFEPIPASPLRAMGFGRPGDSWWRWDRDHFPFWYTGEHWWESGIGI